MISSTPRILLIDDDPLSLESTSKLLSRLGFDVECAPNGRVGIDKIREGLKVDLVLSDVRMPEMGGLEFLRTLRVLRPEIPTVLMTAFGTVDEAVWAMKEGAVDFISKPFRKQQVSEAIRGALIRAREENFSGGSGSIQTFSKVEARQAGQGDPRILGSAPSIQTLRQKIEAIAATDAVVLITGESGTGKELVAREIHLSSHRAKQPWTPLNCAAIPEGLLESELFGYEKGAFSGAQNAKVGLFEAANEGSLFLDEIGELPMSLQPKLLRVLQESKIRRIGASTEKQVSFRLIAATHRDLREWVKVGKFREDLFYRLEIAHLHVPPLRERMEDLEELVAFFTVRFSEKYKKKIKYLHPAVLECFLSHNWPGNVRELSNAIERAVVFSAQDDEVLTEESLPDHLRLYKARTSKEGEGKENVVQIHVGTPLREVEDLLIKKTLEATEGDRNLAAKLLGVNERTIYRRLKS